LLNATVGFQRALARLRPDSTSLIPATRLHRRSVSAARVVQAHLGGRAMARSATVLPALRTRLSMPSAERALPVAVATMVLIASVVTLPSAPAAVGGTTGPGEEPRLVVGGGSGLSLGAIDASGLGFRPILAEDDGGEVEGSGPRPILAPQPIDVIPRSAPAEEASAEALSGPYLADGTFVMGFAPDTTVEDGKAKFRRYRVRDGDTLTGIARRFDISMMTLWWANDLEAKDDLYIGQWLTIPPASGLVVSVGVGDTLESLSAKYGVDRQAVLEVNALTDPNLVVGQTLLLPGAIGKGIPTPKPTPRPAAAAPRAASGSSARPPARGVAPGSAPSRYAGGSMLWPLAGGGAYISQPFRASHGGLDIAARYGTPVRAAAPGRVLFAGWKSNGGGYQVWISHGSGVYTTYSHMAGVSVGRGQVVSKGQQVGRVGSSGLSTGPHLHFEVWKGPIWSGGRRVNPLSWL